MEEFKQQRHNKTRAAGQNYRTVDATKAQYKTKEDIGYGDSASALAYQRSIGRKDMSARIESASNRLKFLPE